MTIERVDFAPVSAGGDNVTGALVKLDQNCADLQEALDGFGSAATRDVGTGAGTVAAGDDARFLHRGRRNLLINGDLRTNQRVFAGGALAANRYGYDRWRTFGSASTFTRSADLSTITLQGTIGQIIEAPNAAGATITVSLWNPSGAVTVNIRPDATTAGVSGTINAGAGLCSVTMVIPSTITGNVFVQLTAASAVTFDGPAKRAGIQLEFGSFASNFEFSTAAEQLVMCQRYFETNFSQGVTPADNAEGANWPAAAYASASVRVQNIPFVTVKRAHPTIKLYSPNIAGQSAGLWAIYASTGTWAFGGSTALNISDSSFSVDISFGGGLTWGQGVIAAGMFSADAELS